MVNRDLEFFFFLKINPVVTTLQKSTSEGGSIFLPKTSSVAISLQTTPVSMLDDDHYAKLHFADFKNTFYCS